MVQYSQLDPQKSEIRLVTLLPGRSCDAIRCTLSTASLDSEPNFTALSYVWGDPSVTKPITVDGEPFDVTLNLEEGLRAIREPRRPRVLWIDAICINQKDVNEKNVQVPQMGRLYSSAPEVFAWLGPSNPNIELFVSWMRGHATMSDITASQYWTTLEARSAVSKSAERERDWAVIQAYEGYREFLALSYWSRMWTFQEYLLPRAEPVLLCGNIQPFQVSTVVGTLDIDRLTELDFLAMERLASEYKHTSREAHALVTQVYDRHMEKIRSTLSSSVRSLPFLRSNPLELLAETLFSTADRQCSKECDKIYALYGIARDAQVACPPDYSKPTTEVMLQATAYMVNIEGSCHILWSRFGLRHERLSDSRLYPSWMPDFSITDNCLSLHVMRGRVATRLARWQGSKRRAFVSAQNATLRLVARCLGTCKVAVRFADTIPSVLEQINGLLQMDVMEDRLGKTIRKPETLIYRMAEAFVAHSPGSIDYSTKEIVDTIYLVLKLDRKSLRYASYKECWVNIEPAIEDLIGKVLLVAEDGCFGISVGGTKDGDIVVIPPEIRAPLVLRPESSTSADGIAYYKMVGTAIIDGVMGRGELFDEEFVGEIAKRDTMEYLLH